MNKKLIVEPLRERLYYANDSFLTYIDSRVLILYSEDLPENWDYKPKFINTHKYFVLESGDLIPCNELYNVVLYNKTKFELDENIRMYTYSCILKGLMEEFENEPINNTEVLINNTIIQMEEIGLTNVLKYKDEIRNAFEKLREKL